MKNLIYFLIAGVGLASADSLNLGFIGLTSHSGAGMPDPRAYGFMKRKISKTGYVVWNPELNLTYEHKGWLFNATYLRDCMDNPTYFAGVGYQWHIYETFHASIIAGPYVKKEMRLSTKKDPQYVGTKVSFVPWISLQKDFMFTEKVGAFVSVSSNYALTHALTGLKFKF